MTSVVVVWWIIGISRSHTQWVADLLADFNHRFEIHFLTVMMLVHGVRSPFSEDLLREHSRRRATLGEASERSPMTPVGLQKSHRCE